MAFSEKTKLLAKRKSSFRCCICHKAFVEVHHIITQSEGGDDTLDNAAPLCSTCHDLYGGNPEKRKSVKQMRNHWWELMKKRDKALTESPSIDKFCEILESQNYQASMLSRGVVLYHIVFSGEDFLTSANILHKIIKSSQEKHPNKKRLLYLDVEGHRNKNGGFDHDMFELQRHFILGFMFQFLTEVHMPIVSATNDKSQINDVPDIIEIFDEIDQKTLNKAIDKNASGIWVSDKDIMLKT